MAITFDVSLGTTRDRIRLTLAQTILTGNRASPIQDETIDALIAQAPTSQLAASYVAQFLSAYWAQRADDVKDDSVASKYNNRGEFFAKMATKLASGALLLIGEEPTLGFSTIPITEPDLTEHRTT